MASLFEPPWPHGVGRGAHRIIMAFMTTRAADADGFVTPQTLAYYAARARGGVGLVTVKMAAPKCCGRQRRRELGIHDDPLPARAGSAGVAPTTDGVAACKSGALWSRPDEARESGRRQLAVIYRLTVE
jgi:2,4-dienoyl-CoA reductase-like NADH-dependent reductase (Old Yellow Enzyme family)